MKKTKSEHPGITFQRGRWKAYYISGGKQNVLGWFDTEIKAVAALTAWRTSQGLS